MSSVASVRELAVTKQQRFMERGSENSPCKRAQVAFKYWLVGALNERHLIHKPHVATTVKMPASFEQCLDLARLL